MGINSVNSQMRGLAPSTLVVGVTPATLAELAVEGYPLTDAEYFLEVEGITGVHHDILEEITYKYGFDREQVVKILLMPKYKGVTTLQLQEEYITNTITNPIKSSVPSPLTAAHTNPIKSSVPSPLTAAQLEAIKAKEDQKKMLMYGGIGVGVLVLLGGIWYFSK